MRDQTTNSQIQRGGVIILQEAELRMAIGFKIW